MMRLLSTTAVLLAALLCTADARYPGDAMAPAPMAQGQKQPKADLTFIIPADSANFTQDGKLVLSGVSQTTAFSAKKGESGIYPTSYFTSVAPGSKFVSSAGDWLDAPQAALYGASSPGNNQSVVLLTLGSPSYDPTSRTLSFTYQYLAPVESSVKYSYGAVGHVVKDAKMNPNGLNVIGQIMPGMSMNGAALFIDSNTMALQPKAETKTWWFPWWGGYNNCWNCGGGYNYGYNNGYYNNGGYYNNNNNNNNGGWGYNNNNNNNNGRH